MVDSTFPSVCYLTLLVLMVPTACWDFIHRPQNKTATIGTAVTIKCEAPISENPRYQFERLDGKVFPARASTDGGKLTITDVQPSDSGWYVCIVRANQGVEKKASAYLTVVAPPKFNTSPHNTTVNIGLTAKLQCEAIPLEGTTYQWLKGDEVLISSGDFSVKTGTLTKYNVQMSDVAIYTCQATTDRGKISASAAILVPGLKPPQFTEPPADVNKDSISARVSLHCSAVGKPTPVIRWKYNDNYLPDSVSTILVKEDGAQTTKTVSVSEIGQYTCEASNIMGVEIHSISISIGDGPTTPTADKRPFGDSTPMVIGIIASGGILLLSIIIGGIVCCCASKKSTYESHSQSYRRSKRRRKTHHSEDYDDNMWASLGMNRAWDTNRNSSAVVGLGVDSSFRGFRGSNLPLSEFDYNSGPVGFNFAKHGGMRQGRNTFSPNSAGGSHHVVSPRYGELDDIESTLKRQMRELDSIPSGSANSTPVQGGADSRHRYTQSRAPALPRASSESDRFSTLSRMMSGDPFEEPEEWGPEHEEVVSLQNNIRMSRTFELTSLRQSMATDPYYSYAINEEDYDYDDYDEEEEE
eukprot:m.309544 g.309544  ORF g.309544 m.309544 type:complete len:582 (+) comp46870_c0_seq1:45-1790(+)